MAAPSASERGDPAGIKLDDGYQTLITIQGAPNIQFWEKTVTPPGLDGGDPIDTTTQHNSVFRTTAPRALITLSELTLTVAYDPVVYGVDVDQDPPGIRNVLNVNTVFTVNFPDGTTLAFWGFLRLFEPQGMEEGAQPEANITIEPSNQDENGDEQAPVMVEVAGT